MTTKIYALADVSGNIRYIGKTCRSLSERFCVHLCDARAGRRLNHRTNWIRSVIKTGILPQMLLIGEAEGNGSRDEIAWIKYFKEEGLDLVNHTNGGEGALGRRLSPKARLRISQCNTGRKMPNHVRQILLNSIKNRKWSAESRKRISTSNMGHIISPETRLKLSLAAKKQMQSHDMRQRLSLANMGHSPSPETRRKLSLAGMGNKNQSGKICMASMMKKTSAGRNLVE